MRKSAAMGAAVLLILCLCACAAAEKVITLSFAGNCTLGSDESTRNFAESFEKAVEANGYGYFFANWKDLFSRDDCTVVGCECVFNNTRDGENLNRAIRYRAPEENVQIFQEGSVEAVALANDHTGDYSAAGLENTKRVLDEAGIGWFRDDSIWIFRKDGIAIAFAAIDYGIYQRNGAAIRDKLLEMRETGEIQAAVLLVHQGNEFAVKHSREQEDYAADFIENAKVDLVITQHPHVLQGIRILNNRTAVYSLGNFVFGGQSRVNKANGADSLYMMAVQARLYFTDEGEYKGQQITLYPGHSSGTDPKNNYQPVRVVAEQAAAVMRAVQADTETELPEVWTDEYGLAYAVIDYLPADDSGAQMPRGEPEPAQPRPTRNNR